MLNWARRKLKSKTIVSIEEIEEGIIFVLKIFGKVIEEETVFEWFNDFNQVLFLKTMRINLEM